MQHTSVLADLCQQGEHVGSLNEEVTSEQLFILGREVDGFTSDGERDRRDWDEGKDEGEPVISD